MVTIERAMPKKKKGPLSNLLIAFYTEGLPFNGETMMKESLGGSETALTSVAKELVKRGHDVKVFCKCGSKGEGTFDGVDYVDCSKFRQVSMMFEWDALIVSRFAQALGSRTKAKLNILWCHDILVERSTFAGMLWQTEDVWLLSQYHKNQYLEQFDDGVEREAFDKLSHLTTNGVDLELVDGARLSTEPHSDHGNGVSEEEGASTALRSNRLIYTSRPERGLLVLLRDIWPRLLQFDPDLELAVCWYDYQNMPLPEDVKGIHQMCDVLIQQSPNVTKLGSLSKPDLYREMQKADLWLYPTAFPEISCIGALEAMACGLVPITTADFALNETVGEGCGVLIEGDHESIEYQDEFVFQTSRLLLDEDERERMARRGRLYVEEHYQWSQVAEQWEQRIQHLFTERMEQNKPQVLESLFRYADVMAAKEFATRHGLEEGVERANKILESAEKPEEEPGDLVNLDPENHTWGLTERFQRCLKIIVEKEPKTFLDIGCHCGTMTVAVSNAAPECKVTGMDFTQAYIDWCAVHLSKVGLYPENVEFTLNRLENLVEEEGQEHKYDVIFAGEWLEHVVDTAGALRRIQRLCKVGGTVVLTLPNGPWAHFDLSKYVYNNGGHVHYFDMQDIQDLFGMQPDLTVEFQQDHVTPKGDLVGNWIISWTNNGKPCGLPDYDRKFLMQVPYQSLSCCMIAKNEAENMLRCLRSVRGIADEIIVCDTGSFDGTQAIAASMGAKVFQIPWNDSFGDARNRSIEEAEGDWILWIDADEVLLWPDRLKKYLRSKMFHGFVIRQNHLTLDMPDVKPDRPCRVFRNHRGYKFTGHIHEHIEDVNRGPFDQPVRPAVVLPDVDIAHFGYITEDMRRGKCSERNLRLLLRDRAEHPERRLTLVLLQRDYINITNWELQKNGFKPTERIAQWLLMIGRIHRENFTDRQDVYHELSYTLYQQSLSILGRLGVCLPETGMPPFEVALGLGGSVAGFESELVNPDRRWYSTREEFLEFMEYKGLQLVDGMGVKECREAESEDAEEPLSAQASE